MNNIQKQRLMTLAKYLENGSLFHNEFNFSHFHCVTSCGSSGCALGECPSLFPNDWYFTGSRPRVKGTYQIGNKKVIDPGAFDAASVYFGIPVSVSLHLFSPNEQKPKFFGGKRLNFNATREDVAENIRDYIKLSETLLGKVKIALGTVFG